MAAFPGRTAICLAALVALLGGVPAGIPQATAAEQTSTVAISRPLPWVGLRAVSLNVNFALTDAAVSRQLTVSHRWSPDVLFVQEVADRRALLVSWAARRGYRLYAPGGQVDARHESVVLYRDSGRFDLVSAFVTAGSAPVRRASGDLIGPRFIATVRVHDRLSGQLLSLSSTHLVPEVQWWGRERPRNGTATLAAFRNHVEQVRVILERDARTGAVSVIGGDFNASAAREAAWPGFMTRVFGDLAVSNHDALGLIGTHEPDVPADRRAIDYVYGSRDARLRFLAQATVDVASDHHALIVDLQLRAAARGVEGQAGDTIATATAGAVNPRGC